MTLPAPPRPLRAQDFSDDSDAHPTADDQARMARAPAVDWAPWRSSARRVRRDTLLALARCAASEDRTDDALATLRQLLAETPDFLPARVLAARLAWSRGRAEEFASLADDGRRCTAKAFSATRRACCKRCRHATGRPSTTCSRA